MNTDLDNKTVHNLIKYFEQVIEQGCRHKIIMLFNEDFNEKLWKVSRSPLLDMYSTQVNRHNDGSTIYYYLGKVT